MAAVLIGPTKTNKQTNNSHTGSIVTDNARGIREIKSIISMAKTVFNRMKALSTSKLGSILRKYTSKLLLLEYRIYGNETWTIRKFNQKYLRSFEIWCYIMMEEISRKDRVINKEVFHRAEEEMNVLHTVKEGRLTGLITSCVGTAF
jgi:hypothetical protein